MKTTWMALGLLLSACESGAPAGGDTSTAGRDASSPDAAPRDGAPQDGAPQDGASPDATAGDAIAGAARADAARADAGGPDGGGPVDLGAPDAAPGEAWPLALPPLLGRPTDRGFTLNLVSAAAGELVVEAWSDGPPVRSAPVVAPADVPVEVVVDGLPAGRTHRWRILGRAGGDWRPGPEGQVRTQPPPGQAFTFTVQADSHLDDRSDVDIYHMSLRNAAGAGPDLHFDLGDTFMCEKHSEPLTAVVQPAMDRATVVARYRGEREHFGIVGSVVPLFLVNGNHEGEQGWRRQGPEGVPEWALDARRLLYPNPLPDGFYSAPPADPEVGHRESSYAFTWGDALFVVLDPFWYTLESPRNGWSLTLGEGQYRWLASTLAESRARWKFVFAHHLVGGFASNRGGIEAAHLYEWGGQDPTGEDQFAARRPGWERPIHDLLVSTGVSIFFHGHDHLYAQQVLDGVIYQEVPQPSATNDRNAAQLAAEGGYVAGEILPSAGILRVRVEPERVQVDYVRTRLGAGNGEVAHTYRLGEP